MNSANAQSQKNEEHLENEWMIRPCSNYNEEYNECTSIRGRFHQYFIHGETLNCNRWKTDFNNCIKWKDCKDREAATEVINSEKERRTSRLKDHFRNNIWQKRSEPPSDWNKPLPDWMAKEYESSYLAHKAKEMNEQTPGSDTELIGRTLCVVM